MHSAWRTRFTMPDQPTKTTMFRKRCFQALRWQRTPKTGITLVPQCTCWIMHYNSQRRLASGPSELVSASTLADQANMHERWRWCSHWRLASHHHSSTSRLTRHSRRCDNLSVNNNRPHCGSRNDDSSNWTEKKSLTKHRKRQRWQVTGQPPPTGCWK